MRLLVVIGVTVVGACANPQPVPQDSIGGTGRPAIAQGGPVSGKAAKEGDAPGRGQPRRPWNASASHLGAVRMGMTVVEAEAALGAPFEPSTDTGECLYRRFAGAPAGVLFMQAGGRIVRVDVVAAGVSTDAGIGVGAPVSQVREAYGTRVAASPHKYTSGEYLTIAPDADHRLVFETDGERVTRYRIGRLPEVEWVEGCA
jgi:hypothetical protein